MSQRRIDYLPLTEIESAARNPKDHDLGAIHESIGRFGFTAPIEIDERTQRLVAGHGRLQTLAQMKEGGQTPPDGIEVDPSGDWLVPVVRGWASKSDADAEAYLLAANRLVELGGWSQTELAKVLEDLGKAVALSGSGYTDDDVHALIAAAAPPPSLETLAEKYGDHDDENFWPKIVLKVPPETKETFESLMDRIEGSNEAERFDKLLAAVDVAAANGEKESAGDEDADEDPDA